MQDRITANLLSLQDRIANAAKTSGRDAEDVTLIAVTKYVDAETTRCLIRAGCRTLGESRPQSLWDKSAQLQAEDVQWHLIGHLQRNKIARTLPCVDCIHSLDSMRLATAIEREAEKQGHVVPVLLEINISGDQAKHGFASPDAAMAIEQIAELSHLRLQGLMGMASLSGEADQAQEDFAKLRELRDRLQQNCPTGITLEELSMGMSRDFEQAIAEGATMVRIGSALFAGVRS